MLFEIWLLGRPMWNISLLTAVLCLAFFYVILIKYVLRLTLYHKQLLIFFCSLLLFYLTIGSPFVSISHLSFSLHMIHMSFLFFIIPPLFLLGIPDLLWQRIRLLQGMSFAALYMFAFLFLLYHIPVILSFLAQNPLMQNGYLILLFLLAFGMWMPIVVPRHPLEKNRYAYISGAVLIPACLLFIFRAILGETSNPLLGQITANFCMDPSMMDSLNPLPFNSRWDQVLAGILMLIIHKSGLFLTVRLGSKVQNRGY